MDGLGSHRSCDELKLRYEEVLSQLCLASRLNEAVSLVENLPDLCISIVNAIIEFTAAENCSIMLSDPETGNLSLSVAKGRDDRGSFFGTGEATTQVFTRGQGAAGWAAENAKILSIENCDLDDRFIKLESAVKEINSVICAPIVAEGSVMGVINCSHPKKRQFSEIDKRNVALVAERAAVLLQKALSVDHLKKDYRELDKQMHENVERNSKTEKALSELRQQLYKSEKFASLGELLAGVAHELNNRVAPILIYSQMLRQQGTDKQDEKRLRVIEESAVGAKAILETLLNYSRPERQERQPINLNQTLQNTLTLTEYKLRNHGIELSLDLCPELPPTMVTEKQIGQVFLNVINNSIHAMEQKGGKLKIRSTYGNDNIRFVIADSGPGIPPEISESIFEPFFTTKESGKGTGLGLSISRRYLEDHKGRIFLDPAYPDGAAFVIEIPRMEPKRETSRGQFPLPTCSENGVRILVVDDDSAIRDVIRDVLGAGYDVEFATDGRDATTKIENDLFDLLVVDYHMPGFDGRQLYEWVVNNRPSLKDRTIFSTGDIYREDIRDFIESTGCRCLIKPFSTADLREIVSGALKV